ncbi:MAG: hypothetical protein WD965_05810 [Actinomycetota bacterium]
MSTSFTVEFGPSRSKRFARAVAEARKGAPSVAEIEPGRYRARFALDRDASVYAALAALIQRVWHWRASEVYQDEETVSPYHAKEMAWCASSQLASYGRCQFRFSYGVFPRCALCPLFDAERAIRDVLGENPLSPIALEIELGPNFRAMLRGEIPPNLAVTAKSAEVVPDFVPDDWTEPPAPDPFD